MLLFSILVVQAVGGAETQPPEVDPPNARGQALRAFYPLVIY